MSNVVVVPHYSLSPNSLTLFERVEGLPYSESREIGWANLEDNKNKYNELSEHSVKRLRKSLSYMLYISREREITGKKLISKVQAETTELEKGENHGQKVSYKLGMITLTLPASQQHPDEIIKSKCLNQFLTELRKNYQVQDYVWKAEKQENGNIHFHIVVNQYIHHAIIRTIWNRIISKLGYVERYQQGRKNFFKNGFRMSDNPADKRSREVQEKAYYKGLSEDFLQPNSTDVHAMYRVKNAAAYLTKYLAKGVTKTQRIDEIDKLRNEKEALEQAIIKIEKDIFCYASGDPEKKQANQEINQIRKRIEAIEVRLNELMKAGVSGRIWGQSQSLSKLKNFVSVENWSDVPQIVELEKNCFKKITLDVGKSQIHTYIFDIANYPQLNSILSAHFLRLSG